MNRWRAGPVCFLVTCLLGAWVAALAEPAAPAEPLPAPWAGAAYVPVAQLHGAPGAVAVSGTRIFLVLGTTVTEWDGASPTRLRQVGRGPILRGPLDHLGLAGDLLVGQLGLAREAPTIEFLDIAAIGAPRWVGGLTADGLSAAAVVDGSRLHYAVGRRLLRIELDDPAAPRLSGTLDLPTELEPRMLAASGGRLYVAVDGGLGVVDSVAEGMSLQGQFRLPITERSVGVEAVGVLADGDRAVLVQGQGDPLATATRVPPTRRRPPPPMQTQTVTVTVEPVRTPRPTVLPTALPMLRVMDLAQAEAPRSMGELRSGIQAVSEAPQGVLDGAANQAYLVGWRIFRVIDISAPTRPRELISWGIDSLVAPALFGDRVLLSDSLRLRNLDLRTPMVPREAGSLELPPWRVADLQTVVPGRVAVALPDFGIRFLDLQHPAAPSEAATLPLSRLRAMRVLTGAGPPLMYLLDGADFVVVNPLDATTPREIGRLRLAQVSVNGNFGRNRLAVTGGIAVLAVESGGLLLVDVADPARPQLVGRYAGCIAEQVVALPSGFVATYCTNTSQLQLVDLRAPRQPRRAAIVGLAGWPMVAVGDFIYLLGSSEPVLDARDPRRPRLLDVDVSIGGMDGEVVGELLYTAGRDVRVYDIREPGAPRLLDTIVVPSLNGLDSNEQALAVDGDSLLVGDSIGTGLTVMVRSAASPEVPDATPTPTAPASASPSSTPVHATGSPSPGSTVTPSATLRPDRQRVVLPWTNRP